ncbi:MAG: cation:proton antiporter [Deltaproteobacteria bacterium]|nr:cation:proton antiporter [Deltaproteobacteria bacterium]
MYQNLAILFLFGLFYSLVAGRLERTPVNGAVVFVAFGAIFGPIGLGLLDLSIEREGIRLLAELTLALVLFTDASNANLDVVRRAIRLPGRMLLLGLPFAILLGFGFGVLLFPGLGLLEVAILATMLAPTDAALGKAVVSNPAVPAPVREGLNVESGLNDGICVPVLLTFLALATVGAGEEGGIALALTLVAEEIGIGLVIGVGLTVVASWGLKLALQHGWLHGPWLGIVIGALAFSCFALAQFVGGSGFIACFTGGLVFSALAPEQKHELLERAEGTGETLALVTWVVFGAAVVLQHPGSADWRVVLYAVLSLTVVRMLPIYLGLTGLDMRADAKLFVGWFGPRGLASIVFLVMVMNEKLPGNDTMVATVVATVALSIIAHGLTANPLAARFGARAHSESGRAA